MTFSTITNVFSAVVCASDTISILILICANQHILHSIIAILMGRMKDYAVRAIRKLFPGRSCISDRVTTDGTTLGLRSIFQWNFHPGVKIRREDDTEQIECLRHSKDTPWSAIVRSWKRRGSDVAWMEAFRCDVFNFSFLRNTPILRRFLYC